ncbi:MAG: PD40 domain-containing protein, partial [Acidobacteria bacterium]|nr:PD40 domain-containing protein [Acidobacteriota bacterium]
TNYGPLARVPAAGGDPRVLTELDAHGGERSHRWPALLPDGDTLVFAVGTGGSWDAARIVAQRVSSGERKILIEGGTSPVFLHPGVLVFARAGSLFAVPFDARKLAVVGSPVEVAGDVLVSIAGRAEVALSAAGSLVAVPAGAGIDRQTLAFASRSGDLTPATREPEEYPSAIRLSRDGRHVLAATSAGLELVDLARGTATPLTTFESGSRAINPVLDATGRRILFASEKNGPWNIFSMPVDGGARPERLWASERTQVPLDASKEGLVLFSEGSSDSLFVRPADASAPEVSVGASAFTDDARLSPDGRYVAYAADESGRRPEIYVKAIPGRGAEGRIQVSAGGGRQARWKSDGTALYFQSGDALVEVPVTLGEEPSAGSPRVLFRASFRWFEPSAEGFLLALSEDPAKRPAPVVVVGWESAVKNRLAPAAK